MKLDRTWLKVERAVQHLEDLERRIALIEEGIFTVSEQPDPETNDRRWVLEGTDRSRHLLGVSMYGVIVGDVVHQLRSALDHVAWKLARPPIEGVTAFPVCLYKANTKGSFFGGRHSRAIGPDRLKNVPKAAFDYIESVQPYNRMGAADPLWQLNEMWNVDKHRTLIVIANPTWNQPIAIAFPDDREAYPGEIKEAVSPEVLRLDANSDATVILGNPGKVRVIFGSDIQAVAGKMVVPTIQWILRYVHGLVFPGLEEFM